MSVLNFKQWMLQEAFSGFKYQFPTDKLQQMADFYVLQMLIGRSSFDLKRQQIVADKGIDSYEFGKPRSIDDQPNKEDQLDYVLQEITNEFLPKLKHEILDDVLFSIISEARHATDGNKPNHILNAIETELGSEYKNIARRFFKDFQTRISSYDFDNNFSRKYRDKKDELTGGSESYVKAYHSFINSKATPEQFVDISKILFEKLSWSQSYGGRAWADICDAWTHLNKAKSLQSMFVYIDHIYDIQHNTGSVFNKVRAYASVERRFKQLLDDKAKMNNPLELYEKVSPSIRKILPMAAKFKFNTGLEDFKKNSQSLQPDTVSDKSATHKPLKNYPDTVSDKSATYKALKNYYDPYDEEMSFDHLFQSIIKVYFRLKDYVLNPQYNLPRFCYSVFNYYEEVLKLPSAKWDKLISQIYHSIGREDKKSGFFEYNPNLIKELLSKQYLKIQGWLETLKNSMKNLQVTHINLLPLDEMKSIISETGLDLELHDFDLNDNFEKEFLENLKTDGVLKTISFVRNTVGIHLMYAKYFFAYFHLKFHIEGKCQCSHLASETLPLSSNLIQVKKIMASPVFFNYIKIQNLLPYAVYKLGLSENELFINKELPKIIDKSPNYWSSQNITNYKLLFKKFTERLSNELNTLALKPKSISPWEKIENYDTLILMFKIEALEDLRSFFLGMDENNYFLHNMGQIFHGVASDQTIEKIIKVLHTYMHSKNMCNCGAK